MHMCQCRHHFRAVYIEIVPLGSDTSCSAMALEETTIPIEEITTNMTISRGEKPDDQLDFSQIENTPVWDENQERIRFGDIYKNQKTIVIFLRHFLCYMAKEYVDDIALVPEKNVQAAGVRIVLIGCGKAKFIEPFRRATGCKFDIFVDPDRNIYKKFHLRQVIQKPSNLKESKHVKSNFLSGILKSTWRGMQYREFQGDTDQQGGAFILGPGNQVHFSHIDAWPMDQAPINDLLGLAGVEQVNFAKDTRVLSL